MKVIKMLIWVISIVVGLFFALSAYLYFNQDNMVFFPAKELAITPGQLNLEYEDIYINIENNDTIHGWFFPVTDSNSNKVVLFCHGNAGNISNRLPTAQFVVDLKVPILMFDYRGYGNSNGKPSEKNVGIDARAYYNWLISEKKYEPEHIIIFGRSLGGAIAVDLASKVKCGGLIIESSFTSALEMGKRIFPFFPINLLLKYRFDSLSKISTINCPVLITHSPQDNTIPFYMGQALYEKAKEPKQFVELSGNHNERNYFNEAKYINAFKKLLNLSN